MERTKNAAGVARHKDRLRRAGGRVRSVSLQPETVVAVQQLIEAGFAKDVTAVLNKAPQALAQRVMEEGGSE